MKSENAKFYSQLLAVLKNWNRSDKLGQNELISWRMVDIYLENAVYFADNPLSRTQALKAIIRQTVDDLFLPDKENLPSDLFNDKRSGDKAWRNYFIIKLEYLKGTHQKEVQAIVKLYGGQYWTVRKAAINKMANRLENIEVRYQQEFNYKFPGGVMSASDPFYVRRDHDVKMVHKTKHLHDIVTIIGSGQMGKTSMMERGIVQLCHNFSSAKVVRIEFQKLHHNSLESMESLLYQICLQLLDKLELDFEQFTKLWESRKMLAAQHRMEKVFEEMIFPAVDEALILAFDEVDILHKRPYKSQFFTMIRNWYNNGALKERWRTLFLFLVISTEPYLLTNNLDQSPFNVSEKFYLSDFNLEQIIQLNQKYQNPFTEEALKKQHLLLNGHPYLSRIAFYEGAASQKGWSEIEKIALDFAPPFREHLHHLLLMLQKDDTLKERVKQILHKRQIEEDDLTIRLLKAGIVKRHGSTFHCRCELYQKFFDKYL